MKYKVVISIYGETHAVRKMLVKHDVTLDDYINILSEYLHRDDVYEIKHFYIVKDGILYLDVYVKE